MSANSPTPIRNYKRLSDLSPEALRTTFSGKKVLVRLDLNVPIVDGKVVDDFRIRRSLPTLQLLSKAGAKIITLAHMESNIAHENGSLRPISIFLGEISGIVTSFAPSFNEVPREIPEGGMVVLENLRLLDEGEKQNDPAFAKKLASFGEVYVNEAFSVSHRAHASIVGVPRHLPSYAGLLFDTEVSRLSEAFAPERPFLFILGGAKFDTKMPLVLKFLKKADTVFVGGALANDVFYHRGVTIGKSVISEKPLDAAAIEIISSDPKTLLPLDAVVNVPGTRAIPLDAIGDDDMILDSGETTARMLDEKLASARFVLWNGPLGYYDKGFELGTTLLARSIERIQQEKGKKFIIGGGDTVAMLAKSGLLETFLKHDHIFISTGGGAMLDLLAEETLPGIEALLGASSDH